ncbi:putative G-protein coupled receptor [Nelusetta ayraudi]|uniref:putative G-protein coupled receptor n=1 Tax=Nelusetta ayraudi TaxID=303726 RepID=UPI003F724CE3
MEQQSGSHLHPDHNDSSPIWTPQVPTAAGRQLGSLPNPQPRTGELTGVFFVAVLNAVALLANTAVLVVVVKAPQLRKFAFVCHLCAVDLLGAASLMPLEIASGYAGMPFTAPGCRLYLFFSVALVAASIFTITAISVERYYYIVHPMRYEVKMTPGLTAAVIAAVWAASLGLGLSTVLLLGWPSRGARSCSLHRGDHGDHGRAFSALFSLTCFCLPAAVIFAVYCNVYKVARVAARQHGALPLWTSGQLKNRSDSIDSQTTIITTRSSAAPRRRRAARSRPFGGSSKAALTLLVIVGQFLVCWLPYFAFHVHVMLDEAPKAKEGLEEAVTWLAYSSFAVNPFFYGLLNRQIREELHKLRRCYGGRPAELTVSGHHENFLQFLHRSSCTTETRSSFSAAGSTLDHSGQSGFRIPGQIPEE